MVHTERGGTEGREGKEHNRILNIETCALVRCSVHFKDYSSCRSFVLSFVPNLKLET